MRGRKHRPIRGPGRNPSLLRPRGISIRTDGRKISGHNRRRLTSATGGRIVLIGLPKRRAVQERRRTKPTVRHSEVSAARRCLLVWSKNWNCKKDGELLIPVVASPGGCVYRKLRLACSGDAIRRGVAVT